MVIGGVGYCDIQGKFTFHKNVLEGLQIYNGSKLYGVFHPRSKNPKAKDRIKYHFMLTPFPYKVWPRTARYVMRLKQKKRDDSSPAIDGQTVGMQKISAFLAKLGVAVIYSFSNRSAHRYSTWDVHVCFDKYFHPSNKFNYEELVDKSKDDLMEFFKALNVEDKDLTTLIKDLVPFNNDCLKVSDQKKDSYDTKKSYYREVYVMAKWIEFLIKDQFPKFLFSDEYDVDLASSIITRVNTSCHYFYYESERLQKKKENKNKKLAYEYFTFRYNNGVLTPDDSGKISQIIKICDDDASKIKGFQLPSICFVEADSHYLNLRLIIVPNQLKHRFFKLSVFHERISEGVDGDRVSRGLLNVITRQFKSPQYKIWKTSTLLFEDRDGTKEESYCNGKLSLFIEVNDRQLKESDADSKKQALEDMLNNLKLEDEKSFDKNYIFNLSHINIKTKCERVYPQLLRRYFKLSEKELNVKKNPIEIKRKIQWDVFLSYASANEELADRLVEIFKQKGVNVFYAKEHIKPGDDFAEEILKAISVSGEFCLLVTDESIKNIWVTSEWGAAWGLKLQPYTPIVLSDKFDEIIKELDIRIAKNSGIKWKPNHNDEKIEKYAEQIYFNRFQRELDYEDYEYSTPVPFKSRPVLLKDNKVKLDPETKFTTVTHLPKKQSNNEESKGEK